MYLIISAVSGWVVTILGTLGPTCVQLAHVRHVLSSIRAKDDSVRFHEILDCRALGQELGVHAESKVRALACLPDAVSKISLKTPSVVPGTTVLLTTTA